MSDRARFDVVVERLRPETTDYNPCWRWHVHITGDGPFTGKTRSAGWLYRTKPSDKEVAVAVCRAMRAIHRRDKRAAERERAAAGGAS